MSDVLYLQAWPGRGDLPERPRRDKVPALVSECRLVVAAVADRDSPVEERFGLLAWRLIDGMSTVGAGLVVPDGHPRSDELATWCKSQRVETPAGPRSWRCETLRVFLDPFGGRFIKLAYRRKAWFVCADVGRVLGLFAEEWTASGHEREAFTIWPVGWPQWHEGKDGRLRRRSVSPHVPSIRVGVMTSTCYRASFGRPPGGARFGKREADGSPFRGRFFDVVAAAVPLDGVDSSDLADHADAFGLGWVEQPAAVTVDPDGAEMLARTLDTVRSLSEVVDDEGRKWLTTARERTEGFGRVDLRWTPTAGTLAARIDERSGASAMLWRPGAPNDEAMARWIAAHHGGWLSCELAGAGLFPAADIDIRSGYPAMYALLGCSTLRNAERFEVEDVAADLRALLEHLAAGDVDALLDPATWRHFGTALCEVVCAGEEWPVESVDADFPEGHSAMRPLSCPAASLPFTWCDVALATLRSGHVVDLRSATRLRGAGLDPGLRARFPLYDGRWVRRGEDVAVALVRLREKAKTAGDDRLAAQLRVVVNAYTYGNLARIDEVEERRGRKRVPVERVAPSTFPPVAASVTGSCRLAIGVAEYLVRRAGGAVAARDTDGLLLVASPEGGDVELDDGRRVEAISWPALDEIMHRLDSLAPFGSRLPFFKPVLREKDGRPLHGVALRVKRYALGTLDERGDLVEVVEATEHGLGGQVIDPPRAAGRAADGRHTWTREVAAEALRQAAARRHGEHQVVMRWAWDEGEAERFPQLQRFQAADPETVRSVAEIYGLSLKPFGFYVLATSLPPLGVATAPPLGALDPSGLLDEWERVLAFYDRSRQPRVVTTDPAKRHQAHVLRAVDEKALDWLRPRPLPLRPVVVTDPRLIRLVGRSGKLVEARAAGDLETPTETLRVEYPGPDVRPVIAERAQAMGPTMFAEAYGVPPRSAWGWANGRPPSTRWIRKLLPLLGQDRVRRCALDGCLHPVSSRHAVYCACPDHPPHRWAAQKRRQRRPRSTRGAWRTR